MSKTLLQINFKFSVSPAELAEAFGPMAEPIAQVPGLRWKIWSLNEATSEFGGIYLFDDADSVQAFLEGPIVDGVSKHPAVSDISAKQFGVIDEFSAITRGPV
ncbi:YdhR family protein [Chloroflexota bacterium]